MADVNKFNLEGTVIDVEDPTARQSTAQLSQDVSLLTGRVAALENLSHLTVSYDAQTKTISFTTI